MMNGAETSLFGAPSTAYSGRRADLLCPQPWKLFIPLPQSSCFLRFCDKISPLEAFCLWTHMCCCLVAKSCLTLCHPMVFCNLGRSDTVFSVSVLTIFYLKHRFSVDSFVRIWDCITHTQTFLVFHMRESTSLTHSLETYLQCGDKKKKTPQANLHPLPAKVKVMKSFNQCWNKPRPWKCDLGVGSSLYNIRQFSHNDVIMLMSALPRERIKMNIGNQEFGKQTIHSERLATPSFP